MEGKGYSETSKLSENNSNEKKKGIMSMNEKDSGNRSTKGKARFNPYPAPGNGEGPSRQPDSTSLTKKKTVPRVPLSSEIERARIEAEVKTLISQKLPPVTEVEGYSPEVVSAIADIRYGITRYGTTSKLIELRGPTTNHYFVAITK